MKNRPITPTVAYTTTLELINFVLTHGHSQERYLEDMTVKGYERSGAPSEFRLQQDVVITIQNLRSALSSAGNRLLDKITDGLYMNNALWYHEPSNNREYTAINELIKQCVLVRTEDSYIYFVNPIYVRRGSISGVLAMTMKMLKGVTKPTKDHLHDLKYSREIEFNPSEVMSTGLLVQGMTRLLTPSDKNDPFLTEFNRKLDSGASCA